MEQVDLLVTNAAQVVTCASRNGPKRGPAMAEVGLIENGTVAVKDGRIVAVGPAVRLERIYAAVEHLDARGKAVCPGFVDCHTHTVFGGDRVDEFALRIKGATYMEIMAAGGGILSTMRHTRQAAVEALVAAARRWLDEMLAFGSTTVEIKTGYGLDTATELKMLRAIEQLAQTHPCGIVPTFLGAHTLPPEFEGDAGRYARLVVNEMLPAVIGWYQNSSFSAAGVPLFIDVFCEDHAFNVEQSRDILQAGLAGGLGAKIHVDQFNEFGGLAMAVELGAISADHLDVTGSAGIKRLVGSDTVATLLPAVNFNLDLDFYADARAMVDAGAAIALATDFNPGSAPCLSMPLVMAIACRKLRLLPAEALNASTINAAYALGMGERLGSIEVGKQADLLILKSGDYRHIPYYFGASPVETVIKQGHVL